jgi:hypothetical protein
MGTSLLHPNRRKGRKPDTEYLEFIRSLPCVVCADEWCTGLIPKRSIGIERILFRHQKAATEAAHVGSRGLGQKSNDRETIPLCRYHHRIGRQSHHKLQKEFWTTHNLNRAELIAHYQKLFLATRP